MRKTLVFVVLAILCVAPAFAQGPFNDVPTDHWAYDAVNTLQKDGIVIGYPDGTFGGKRAMSRYEFAVAIARIMPLIGVTPATGAAGVTNEQLQNALSQYAKRSELPNMANYCTKADCDAIRKLVDEFRDELAALGVDVDALKRDVAALTARVCALENEVQRVHISGDVNVFAIATDQRNSVTTPVDLDERQITGGLNGQTLGRTISVVRDFDLNITGRVSQSTTAFASINYGNYLNYVSFVDDYVDGVRPTNKTNTPYGSGVTAAGQKRFTDTFFPYYMYINAGMGKGALTVGRLPLQFTPYTMKKIDVDSYTTILKTDSGNYPVDGAKLAYNFGGVDLTLFAAKHDENDYLQNGLTGQPTAGLFDQTNDFVKAYTFRTAGPTGGHSVGGLNALIAQSAGVRAQVGTPWKGVLGATFYQAWSGRAWDTFSAAGRTDAAWDQARVYGADLNIPIAFLGFAGSWTKSDTLAADGSPAADVTDDNTAWDGKLTATLGKLGIGAGYKNIERNFSAAGFWDKIGRWTNPVNVKGPYADFSYPFSGSIKLVLNGEFLKFIDDVRGAGNAGFGAADDDLIKAEGGIRWGFSKANSLDLGYQWIKFNPKAADLDEAIETYLTIGWAHQMSASTGFKVGYQFINYDGGANNAGPYGGNGPIGDYKGGLGVVQFGVSF